MSFKIEKNIPIPTPAIFRGREKGSRLKGTKISAMESLEIGESIFFEDMTTSSAAALTFRARKNTGHKFTVRSVDGGKRIWRTE